MAPIVKAEKKKKDKVKKVKNQDAEPTLIDEVATANTANGEAAANAIAKKEKKKKKKVKASEAEPEAVTEVEAVPTEKPKKDKKKKKEKRERDDNNDTSPAEPVEQEPSPKKQKSTPPSDKPTKKPKSKLQPDTSTSVAEVGNHGLAKSLPKIRKQLYIEHEDVTKLSAEEVQKVHEEKCTIVEGSNIKPVLKFEQTGLPAPMLHSTRDFVQPSPIQSQCWPIILSGHDLVGIAATGSGKTLAFGLPALRHIAAQKEAKVFKGKGPFALVMAPTRELAIQIAEVLSDAGSKCKCSCLCVYGGVPKHPQMESLRAGVDIVVGTPGRLEDLMEDGCCKLNEVTYLVLDEADRMLDLGFEPHIRAIASAIRSDRQTLMFSATWPSAVQKLAANYLTNPIRVTIGSQDLSASHSVTQVVEVIEQFNRDKRLLELLKKYHSSKKNRIIIFVLYKKEAPRVEQLLQRGGWKGAAIHGDISQHQRTQAVEQFKSGEIPLLIATDVAARGLDIPDVEVVINYSFPLTTEDYVHRIGRTGRAGKTGLAHTFFCSPQDKPRAGELINVLREAGQTVPEELLKFGTTVKKKESKLYGSHFKDVDFTKKASKISFDSDDE